jgi:hypothetical protein
VEAADEVDAGFMTFAGAAVRPDDLSHTPPPESVVEEPAPPPPVQAAPPPPQPVAPAPVAAQDAPTVISGGYEPVAPAQPAPAAGNGRRAAAAFVPAEAIRAAAEEMGLRLPSAVYAALAAALATGRHVVITGPAGSGKTTLALAVAKAAAASGKSAGAALVTSGAEWGEAEASRHVLRAAERERWLIVDEIDRADVDRAFGALSAFLAGLPTEVQEREVTAPQGWRLLATADTGIAASGALTRRFARIKLRAPAEETLAAAIDAAAQGDVTAAGAARRLARVREIVPLGAGPFVDAARHAAERNAIQPASESELARECFSAYLEPHLTRLDEQARARLEQLKQTL